jgi:5-oxoprolinase (ATP-hydrolysing) subunit A
MRFVDLNCDMGEGCGNDSELMSLVSSANIACGYHAGDEATMRRTVGLALENDVAIGAHPGYDDRKNFGRTQVSLSTDEIRSLIVDQVAALRLICDEAGGKLHHVKPHGALYNQAAKNQELAKAIAVAIASIDTGLILYGLSGSHLISEGEAAGLRTSSEVFADRTYQSDGSLTSRTEPNALITDDELAVSQVLQMATSQTVTAVNGDTVSLKTDTICIHGDGEHAVHFARAVRRKLTEHGIKIQSI